MMSGVKLNEPRAIRKTVGTYRGPTIRVSKNVSWRMGRGTARSVSHDEITHIDTGTLVLTNKRLIFLGWMKSINIDLRKIVSITPYKDGIGSQMENKQKTEYFVGTNNTTLPITRNREKFSFPVSRDVLKIAIYGKIAQIE